MAPTLGLHSAVFWKMQNSGDHCESVDVLLWVFISILLYIICAHRLILCVNSPGELFSQREDFLNLYMCFKNPKFDPDKDNASVEYSVFSDFRYCDVRNKMAAPMDLMFTCMLWAPTMNIAILRGALDIYWHCKVYIFMRLTVDNIFRINFLFPFELSIFVSWLYVACCMLNECDISMSVYVC